MDEDSLQYWPLGHIRRKDYAEILDKVEEILVDGYDVVRGDAKNAIELYCRTNDGDPADTPDRYAPETLAESIFSFPGYWRSYENYSPGDGDKPT
jgi:hypothetical protein